MNVEALFLFLILLLGLVLCSFLGGNCNNKEGFTQDKQTDSSGNFISSLSSNQNSSSNNSSNNSNSNNSTSSSNGDNYNHYSGSSTELTNDSTFTGSNGGTVTVKISSDGKQYLQVTPPDGGSPMTFTVKESMTSYSGDNGSASKFYGPF